MSNTITKTQKRLRRHSRIRSKVSGTADLPRFAVYRSNRFIYAQLIDDEKAVTLLSLDSRKVKGNTPMEKAKNLGIELAKKAVDSGIKKVVFDRGGFIFMGSIKELADGAREGGLKF